MRIYTTTMRIYTGKRLTVAVRAENETEAKGDLRTAMVAETNMPFAMTRLGMITEVASVPADMWPIHKCTLDGEPWAWAKIG